MEKETIPGRNSTGEGIHKIMNTIIAILWYAAIIVGTIAFFQGGKR